MHKKLLPVFACSVIIKVGKLSEAARSRIGNPVRGRIVDSHQTQKMTLQQGVWCFGATCLAALFGIQQLPSSWASSLSVGPQHLFPLLYRNFLFLARNWTLSICVQITVSLRAINSIIFKVVFLFFLLPFLSFALLCFFSDDNRRKHHSTREDCEAFLTRAFKCHAVPLHVIDTSRCQKCKLSSLSSAGEIKKKKSKVNRYLGLTFNCSDM